MDQKNTIVKCKAYPDCLFNHNGVCDNYVINIDADGKCECYIETELIEYLVRDPAKTGLAFKEIARQMDIQRGQRAKCNVSDDVCDIDISDWYYAATPDICKTCKKVVYGQPCKWKDVAYGVWTCYEEARDEV